MNAKRFSCLLVSVLGALLSMACNHEREGAPLTPMTGGGPGLDSTSTIAGSIAGMAGFGTGGFAGDRPVSR